MLLDEQSSKAPDGRMDAAIGSFGALTAANAFTFFSFGIGLGRAAFLGRDMNKKHFLIP